MDWRRRHGTVDGVSTASHFRHASSIVIDFRNVGKTYRSLLGTSVKAVEEFSLVVAEGEMESAQVDDLYVAIPEQGCRLGGCNLAGC